MMGRGADMSVLRLLRRKYLMGIYGGAFPGAHPMSNEHVSSAKSQILKLPEPGTGRK